MIWIVFVRIIIIIVAVIGFILWNITLHMAILLSLCVWMALKIRISQKSIFHPFFIFAYILQLIQTYKRRWKKNKNVAWKDAIRYKKKMTSTHARVLLRVVLYCVFVRTQQCIHICQSKVHFVCVCLPCSSSKFHRAKQIRSRVKRKWKDLYRQI